jgi:hypothetical protein
MTRDYFCGNKRLSVHISDNAFDYDVIQIIGNGNIQSDKAKGKAK